MNSVTPMTQGWLARAKWAFSTRRVIRDEVFSLSEDLSQARSGDLVLGRIEQIGSHKRIQLAEGRPSELYRGDLVVLACGDRYAPDQFEGIAEVDPDGADMLAAGGVLGRMRHRHDRMAAPTRITPLGLLLGERGEAINLASYCLDKASRPEGLTVIGVVGTSMNAGKTTAVAALAHGLSRAGHQVAAIKATGTGAFGDYNAFLDAGASYVGDFVDVGMASTYRQPLERIAEGLEALLAHADGKGCEIAVVELADGVFQQETAALLGTDRVREGFDAVVFAAPDALSAAGGCAALRVQQIEPAVVTGMVSCSPLGAAEAELATGVRVVCRDELCDPKRAAALLERMRGRQASSSGDAINAAVGVAA